MLFVLRFSLVFLSCVVPGSSLRRNSKQGKENQTWDVPWYKAWSVPRPDCTCSLFRKECLKKQVCTDYCNQNMELSEGPATHEAKCFAKATRPLNRKGCWCTNMCIDGVCRGKTGLTKFAAHVRDECKGKCPSNEKCIINQYFFDERMQKVSSEDFTEAQAKGMWCVNYRGEKNAKGMWTSTYTRVDWTWDGRGIRQ